MIKLCNRLRNAIFYSKLNFIDPKTIMQKLTRTNDTPTYPIRIAQFGEGNFLRAFVDWMVQHLNETAQYNAGVAVIQPLPNGMVHLLNHQGGLYHHVRQGLENGQTIDEVKQIQCISQCIDPFKDYQHYVDLAKEDQLELVFSNTTEAGIVYDENDHPKAGSLASTFPGKLTQLLKTRFDHFSGDPARGLGIVPCELIENNGTNLKACILAYADNWDLGNDFKNWVDHACSFANTLVDRIVPGYPKEEIEELTRRIGVEDQLIVKSEAFHLFVIQADERIQRLFPADQHGLNVKYVQDITPYRTQKVRILNGAHTSMVPVGLLHDLETVSETVNDDETGKLVKEIIFDEIVPTIQIPGEDPKEFANEVIARFQNPFIRHELISISLNSIAKFKVRVLPSLLDFLQEKGRLPNRLAFSLACLIQLYANSKYTLKDDPENLEFFSGLKGLNAAQIVAKTLSNSDFWDRDLTKVTGLAALVTQHLTSITSKKMEEVLNNI